MGTERYENTNRKGYRTDTEWVWNRYGTLRDWKKKWKKHSIECIWQENAFFRMHACKLRYQSAHQGFRNDATLNTHLSNFCLACNLEKMTEWIILCPFLFLFTCTKQASVLICIFLSLLRSWWPFCFCQQGHVISKLIVIKDYESMFDAVTFVQIP